MTTGNGDEFTARMFDAINAMMCTCSRLLPARITMTAASDNRRASPQPRLVFSRKSI
jgi:hypothetical protein